MRRRGFTLIELLVAIALGSMLLFLASHVFRTAVTSRQRLIERSAELGQVRRTYDLMSRDLHSAVVPPDDSGLQFGLAGVGAGLGNDVLQFASVIGEPMLAGRAANETVLVQYSVEEHPRTAIPTLFRHETPYPVPEGAAPGDGSDTRSTPLIEGVTGVSYLFYSTVQQNWVNTWEGETGLPAAIRMDMQLQDPTRPQRTTDEPQQESWMFSLPAAKYANDQAAAAQEAALAAEGTAP